MGFKGQTELILIVGIIVVVAVVIALTFSTGLIEPSNLGPDERNTKESVESFIRTGAYDTIGEMGLHGGYLDGAAESVTFLGQEVPYWQESGQLSVPDITANLAQGVETYISENKDVFAESMDKDVTIGEPQVTATVLPSQVKLTVYMPVTVGDSSLPQPFIVNIPTKLGDIYEFSQSFVTENNQQRFFEYFTLSSIILSPFDDGVQEVPTMIYLTQCGEFVSKNWWEIQPDMLDVIERTLANTYMPSKAPIDFRTTTGQPKYSLTSFNGKGYEDIDVSFYLPDDFELERSNFDFTPEPLMAFAKPVPLTTVCHSEPIYVNYYLRFPVIVRIEDPLTQDSFQYAVEVYIKDNQPGSWGDVSGYQTTAEAEICGSPACPMYLEVLDISGRPVSGAGVTFMGCSIGRTDSQGRLSASAPCGIGPLKIYESGFDVYDVVHSSTEIEDMEVVMTGMPVVNLQFFEVVIDNVSATGEYWIKKGAVSPIDNMIRDGAVRLSILEGGTADYHEMMYADNTGQMIDVPSGRHTFSGVLYEGLGDPSMSLGGAFSTDFTLTDEMDGKSLYVYLPYYPEMTTGGGVDAARSVALLSNILRECGFGPITEEQVADDAMCTITYEEALTVE